MRDTYLTTPSYPRCDACDEPLACNECRASHIWHAISKKKFPKLISVLHGLLAASCQNATNAMEELNKFEVLFDSRIVLAKHLHVQEDDRHQCQYYSREARECMKFYASVLQPICMCFSILRWKCAGHHKVSHRLHWVLEILQNITGLPQDRICHTIASYDVLPISKGVVDRLEQVPQ